MSKCLVADLFRTDSMKRALSGLRYTNITNWFRTNVGVGSYPFKLHDDEDDDDDVARVKELRPFKVEGDQFRDCGKVVL